jgi:outer membrane biosynthesis protein TonB
MKSAAVILLLLGVTT